MSNTPEAQRTEHIRALEAFAQLAMGASTKAALLAGADALRQQAERASPSGLLKALKSVTEHMDRAGGDAHGWPECPWCHADSEGNGHRGDCELVTAREVIIEAEAALLSGEKET